MIKDIVFCLRRSSLKNIWNNICWAFIGLAVDVSDPWLKREVEVELDSRHIKYFLSYNQKKKRYIFAIIGGKKKKIYDFVDWFKSHEEWRNYKIKHMLFKNDIVCLRI